MGRAALIDLLTQIDDAFCVYRVLRIARRDAAHFCHVAVAIRARFLGVTFALWPLRNAVLRPQHRGVLCVVFLQHLRGGLHAVERGFSGVGGERGCRKEHDCNRGIREPPELWERAC